MRPSLTLFPLFVASLSLPFRVCDIADTFGVPTLIQEAGSDASVNVPYNMTDRGITWPGESRKYQPTRYQLGEAVPPPFWQDRFPNGYTAENPYPDLSQDEHFQVWMRTAGLPTFRKLYFRNDNENMVAGRYSIGIYTSEHGRSEEVAMEGC